MSKAIAAGLYHPRCKDSHTTYFPGISTADDTWTKKELEAIGEVNRQEAQKQYAERQTEKYERLEKHSLDADNRKQYKQKANTWQDIVDDNKRKTEALKANPEVKKESKTEKMMKQLEASKKKTEESKQELIRTYMEMQGMSYDEAQRKVEQFVDDARQKIRGKSITKK